MFKENTFYKVNVNDVHGFNNEYAFVLKLEKNDIILVTQCVENYDCFIVSLIFDFKQYEKIMWSYNVKNYFSEII